jgi:cytochrome c-type biogenesis protein
MIQAFTDALVRTIQTNVWLAPVAAMAGGLLTAANPCVIASVPLMMGYVAGQEKRGPLRSFLLALTFVAGLTVTFGVLFFTAWLAGSAIGPRGWTYVAVVVCLVMGLHLMGVLKFTIPAPAGFQPSRRGFAGALLLGVLFGLISMPCAGPILVALLALVPLKGALFGGLLLAAYTLGHSALILVGATSVGLAQRLIASRGLQQANAWAKRAAGSLVTGVGLYLLWAV